MAHECPECGMDCDCCGDIDDASVMSHEWVNENCCHECDEDGYILEDLDDDEVDEGEPAGEEDVDDYYDYGYDPENV